MWELLIGAIPVSALVSLATTMWIRSVDQKKPKWFVNGYSWPLTIRERDGGKVTEDDTEKDRYLVRISNVGNGSAYAVKMRTNPGGEYKTTEHFIGPAIASGDHTEHEFPMMGRGDDTAYVEIVWTESRTFRGPRTIQKRIYRPDWYIQSLDAQLTREVAQKWFPKQFLEQ